MVAQWSDRSLTMDNKNDAGAAADLQTARQWTPAIDAVQTLTSTPRLTIAEVHG